MDDADQGLKTVRDATLLFSGCLLIVSLGLFWYDQSESAFIQASIFLTGFGVFSSLACFVLKPLGRVLLKGYYLFFFLALALCFVLSARDVLTESPEDIPTLLTVFALFLGTAWAARRTLVSKLNEAEEPRL